MAQATSLLTLIDQALAEFTKAGQAHLLASVKWQETVLKKIINQVKAHHPKPLTAAQIKSFDDQIKFRESRLGAELVILRDYLAKLKPHSGKASDLVAHGKASIAKATAALAHDKVPAHQVYHLDITAEVKALQAVVARLAHNPTGAELQQDTEILERTQRSLGALLAKIGVH